MTVNIENEYLCEISMDYKQIIREVIEGALEAVRCLTDNERIREINREQRGIDRPTDVLSFPMIAFRRQEEFELVEEQPEAYFDPDTGELNLGDIVVSMDKVYEQAQEFGHSPERELAFLIAHSMLHLSGYDHEEKEEQLQMEAKQEDILQNKGYTRD